MLFNSSAIPAQTWSSIKRTFFLYPDHNVQYYRRSSRQRQTKEVLWTNKVKMGFISCNLQRYVWRRKVLRLWENQSCFRIVWEPLAQGRENEENKKASVEKSWNSREDGFYNLIMILNLKSLMDYLKRCKLKALLWPSQSPDLKGSDLAKWPNNPTELEDFWMEEGTNIPQTCTGPHLAG